MTPKRPALTPALLGQLGKAGVTTGSGQALPAPPAQLSTHELKARGWSATMIAKLLPRPDGTRANQLEVGWSQKRLTAPVKLYDLARVEEAETTEDFLIGQATATKGRAAAAKGQSTRAAKLQAYVDGYTPQLPDTATPLRGNELWRYHLGELTMYEHTHTEQWLALSRAARQQGSNQLYHKHREAFRAKFGPDY